MLAKDIVIGNFYRHKTNPHNYWAQAVKVLKPKEGENTTSSIVVKCRWMQEKDDTFSFVKYFKPSDLIKNKEI